MLCKEIVATSRVEADLGNPYRSCGRNAVGYLTFSNDEGESVEVGYCREHANSIRQMAIGYQNDGTISSLHDTLFEESVNVRLWRSAGVLDLWLVENWGAPDPVWLKVATRYELLCNRLAGLER